MPELPEVEAAREDLERWLARRAIRDARVIDRRIARGQDPRQIEAELRGARVRAVRRRGKFIILDLGPRRTPALLHLGMTGDLIHLAKGEAEPRAAKVVLDLGGGRRVVLADPRILGRFVLLKGPVEKRIARLGVEPLSPDFTAKALRALLARSRAPMKLFLMDQDRIAGLGNIHAAEALFLAGIHPARPASSLSPEEAVRLRRAIRKTLLDTMGRARRGETRASERGGPSPFRVYGHLGEPCPRCDGKVARISQGGRSTYFCPRCQPASRH